MNAIATIAAIGGSTNAQPHLVAMARHAGLDITPSDWMKYGHDIPLLVNMQPAGKYLGERFHRAGGVPAVLCELLRAGRIDGSALSVTGQPIAKNIAGRETVDREVIKTFEEPLQQNAGFLVLSGNLFDFAIMKTSVISEDFRKRFLSNDNAFEGRAVVFDGSTDYHDSYQRSLARHRRSHDPRDPRLRSDRLARLGRGREHAAARCAARSRHHEPADPRRRTPIRHVRQPLDPQLLTGERGGRRPGLAAHRRLRSASISSRAAATPW